MTLSEFDATSKKAQSIKELNIALDAFLTSFGITTYAFTYYSYYPNRLNKLKYDYSSKNYSLWHKHYISEGYEESDSTLDVVYQTSMPTFWDLNTQLLSAKSAREKKMREDSIAYGVEKGLSIPIHGPQEDFAIFLLVQMRGQNCLENYMELQYEFFVAGYYYYHYLHQLILEAQPSDVMERLSAREIQCLTLLAKQYSLEAIAKSLNITERTVNYHIQRLNKKLGTQNKYQSVIKAIKKGLIRL